MDLTNIIASGGYNGLVTFSDIHAHAKKLKKGIRYALKNNLFIIFLGDLVDGHDRPLETVLAVKAILDAGTGVLVIGNHDDKFYRYAKGNPVILKKQNKQTLADVPKGGEQLFLQTMIDLAEHQMSDHMHRFANWRFIHGAAHVDVWADPENPDNLTKKAKHRAMYGEVNGETEADGFPVRLYNWVDEIPSDHNVIVGHDRKPYGAGKLADKGPLDQTGVKGGRAVFTDMGCGKGGVLCLSVFKIEGDQIEMTGHKEI